MASTSASSVQKSFKYDVFISFRGEDTRKNFVDHLYKALVDKSIHDVRITKGKRISDELITAIQDSRFYIVIFSENYASSSWCLDELVQIMEEWHKSTFHTAYPVFYDVEPTEIRNQTGSFGEAFSILGKKEAAGKWREALKEAAGLAGWELKNTCDGHEAKVIQKIVEEISLELRFIDSSIDGKLIGMESRVKGIVSALETGSADDVRMIGIKGIGGGGKTTLARAVFDHISFQFEGKSFVENVREVSKASLSGLKKLQKQLLSDVLNDKGIKISSVHDGKNMIKKMMCGRKVLVVLDDVDNIYQLEALASELNWFKPGSRIIITTRDEQVLVAHRVNVIRDVNLLSDDEAVCLFSRYAFGKEIPIHGYEELSRRVVSYAAGLPLTISVLGSFLCGKDVLEWKDAIDRLDTYPLRETLEILELSYNGLEEDYKEIFLDVACILKGWGKDDAVEALESCGFYARNGLRVLEQKSLISIKYGHLDMHDHIEEMGKNIVRRSRLDKPCRQSRLWVREEIEDILANDLGTKATRCIKLEVTENFRLETFIKGFGKMKKLRVLNMYTFESGDRINPREVLNQCLPDALRYVKWDFYPFESIMKSFQEDHLVGLSLCYSKIIQFWKIGEKKVLYKLRFLDIANSFYLKSLNLQMIPNIEKLNLKDCWNLVEFSMPIECSKLKALNLQNCGMLKTLNLAPTPDLETLNLRECWCLEELNMPIECSKLKTLNLQNCGRLRTVELATAPDLETLTLEGCTQLAEVNMPFRCPRLKVLKVTSPKLRTLDLRLISHLKTLSLENCNDLLVLHMVSNCSNLRHLTLKNSALNKNVSLRSTPDLETLYFSSHDLVELHIPSRCTKLKSLCLYLSKLRTLDLRRISNLETLSLENCYDLVKLHMPSECSKLRHLTLKNSAINNLKLAPTPDLKTFTLEGCEKLVEVNMPSDCPKLEVLKVSSSKFRTALDLDLISNLKTLCLENCNNLLELHMPTECSNLRHLILKNSAFKNLRLGSTPNLKTLYISSHDLVELHIPFRCPKLESLSLHLPELRMVNLFVTSNFKNLHLGECHALVELRLLDGCPKLRSLYLSLSKLRTLDIGMTLNIETISLTECWNFEEFRMPFNRLNLKEVIINKSSLRTLNLGLTPNLESLNLAGCRDLVELHLLDGCPNLKFLYLNHSKLRTLDIGMTLNLERLDLKECFNLVEVHAPVGCLKELVYLDLSGSWRFKNFLFEKRRYHSPEVGSLAELDMIVESTNVCPLHPDSNLPKFQFTCFYNEYPPSASGNLEKLISVGLCACTNLESFSQNICGLQFLRKLTLEGNIPEVPKDLHMLEYLEELSLSSTEIKHLPNSICMLKSLKILQLKSFWLLEKLPEDLGRLERLEELHLKECLALRDIPNSICKMRRLRKLYLPYCIAVEELPEEVGTLECLKELNIEGTGITNLPRSIYQLKGLSISGSKWRLQSYKLEYP